MDDICNESCARSVSTWFKDIQRKIEQKQKYIHYTKIQRIAGASREIIIIISYISPQLSISVSPTAASTTISA